MAAPDLQYWLEAVADDAPCGPNLEFDADFGALERAAQGKPEQQVGDTLIPGEPPDWKDVGNQATALLERSRDLRVAGHYAVAGLPLRGLPGYAEGLGIVRALLQERWDTVHPQLDPEDDNDPTLRANALLRLGDPAWVMRTLRDLPLAVSPKARVSWREIAVATGALEPEDGQQKPTEATLRGAFADSDPARLEASRGAIGTAVSDIVAIPAAFDTNAGHGSGPDFTALQKLLQEIFRGVERFGPVATAADAGEAGTVAAEAAEATATPDAGDAPARRAGGVSAASLTAVTSRSDALRLLDLVCQYYARNEPSSPLPLLIERARRLADKSFLDVLRDLAPDGLQQAQAIAGPRDE